MVLRIRLILIQYVYPFLSCYVYSSFHRLFAPRMDFAVLTTSSSSSSSSSSTKTTTNTNENNKNAPKIQSPNNKTTLLTSSTVDSDED